MVHPQGQVDRVDPQVALETIELSKHFGGVDAVRGVTLQVQTGEVLALVGDNGAGKSTLVKMLSGVVQPSSGEIRIDGRKVVLRDAADARAMGIETVFQDLALCPDLTAAENLFLGREPVLFNLGPLSVLDRKAMRRGTAKYLGAIGATVPLNAPVRRISGGQRQAVAIARATSWGQRVILFDEPTAALGVAQSARTLELVRDVARQGRGVVMISHNLDDIFAVADRIAVMRLGRLTEVVDARETRKTHVHRLMAGLVDDEPTATTQHGGGGA